VLTQNITVPGANAAWNIKSGIPFMASPIIADLNGAQAEPDWRLFTGVAVNF